MISNNGSTYLSAAEELRSLLHLPEIKEEFSKKGDLFQRELPGMGVLDWAH